MLAYPPPPQAPCVVTIGNYEGGARPSESTVELSRFLFGVEPPPPLALANPTALAAGPNYLLICDESLHAVFRWDAGAEALVEEGYEPPLDHPASIAVAPNGDRLICDGERVVRASSTGVVLREYALPDGDFRPSGVLAVNDEVWASNLAGHRIDIFDAESGVHQKSIMADGVHLGLPRGLARMPNGDVCVVDALYASIQVFDDKGEYVRQISGAGDSIGSLGRPKHVAVGPDGTIFVTDSFSQRVHVFDQHGCSLLAFGEPESGGGALTMPSGIAILNVAPNVASEPPPSDAPTPVYYILVSEQLDRPGVRVYGWLGERDAHAAAALAAAPATKWKPRFPESAAINPHWDAGRCDTCHQMQGENPLPIPKSETDKLCLSCHDGEQAPQEPHPIYRSANTEMVQTPDAFPTYEGRIGCLTCHDIKRHCDPAARRPAINSIVLREYDPQQALNYCMSCHQADSFGRFSPHRQRDAQGRVRDDACFFCHTQKPEISADGRRRFEPHLRDSTSRLCLGCHEPHWDLSPRGHVDRPVTPPIRRWMLMRQADRENAADVENLAELADASPNPPALIPLGGVEHDMVTCFTCHNPHYAGLFPDGGELGALANNETDRAAALRVDFIELCSECHRR